MFNKLTQVLRKVDAFFFGNPGEFEVEDIYVRPLFYGAIIFATIVVATLVVAVFVQ